MARIPRWFLLTTFVLGAGVQWNCGSSKVALNPAPGTAPADEVQLVKASPVQRQAWIATVSIFGSLRTLSSVDVKPEVAGRLVAVYFEEGDFVRKDQPLAEIDPVNYRLALDQAAAALSVAEAGLERAKISAAHAETEKERADNLLRSGGITEKDHLAAETGVKEAESQVRLAEAQVGQARAALEITRKALKDCRILAPAAGQVQKMFFDKGSLLAAGAPLCTLVDNSRLELECVIPSYQLASVRPGQRAAFTTPTYGERRFEAAVSAINPEVQPESRSATLKLKIANPGGELRSGMYASGEITTGREENALVIPRDSLIPEENGSGNAEVYVIRDGKAQRVGIRIGGSQQDRVWARQGLSGDELVITEIGPSLKDGARVRVLK